MALIPFPSGVLVTRADLELAHPGQVVLRSLYGAAEQVLGRGPGHWQGRLEIAETDRSTDGQRRAVEAFLSRLRGSSNTFEVPLQRPGAGTLRAGSKLKTSAFSLVSGELEITVTGAATGLVAGDFIRIWTRTYQLIGDQRDYKFKVEPPAPPQIGAAVMWRNTTAIARLRDAGGAGGGYTPDFRGPWTLDWQEAL